MTTKQGIKISEKESWQWFASTKKVRHFLMQKCVKLSSVLRLI
ncbi:hypothetical protein [Stenoxybacter acetivorans]|nr:hypothetical protein [Stenoxybacter acetivorans]